MARNSLTNLRTYFLRCRKCGHAEISHTLEMLAWIEAECCGEECMEISRVDQVTGIKTKMRGAEVLIHQRQENEEGFDGVIRRNM